RWRELLTIFQGAGRGLAAAHAKGLIHRDFKPENVMVDKDGRARVMDFGLARSGRGVPGRAPADLGLDANASVLDVGLTRDGAILGTPRYMASEQFTGGEVDARSDQFAFCVAL